MRLLILTIVLILLSSSLMAQADNVAPVVWERYKVSAQKVSFMMPKLPVVRVSSDPCSQIDTATYRAYAEAATYVLTITSRTKGVRPRYCRDTSTPYDDDAKDLEELVDRAQHEGKFVGRLATKVGGLDGFRFSSSRTARIVLSDIEANGRSFDLQVSHHPDMAPDLDRFFGSLQIGDTTGKEIDKGALVTLGDAGTPAAESSADKPKAAADDKSIMPYVIAARDRPSYTDAARRANVQGFVRLKVNLLANGAVGKIVVDKELPHGLTDHAILAARRITFLPQLVNGKPTSVTVTIEYGFSLY